MVRTCDTQNVFILPRILCAQIPMIRNEWESRGEGVRVERGSWMDGGQAVAVRVASERCDNKHTSEMCFVARVC